MYKGCSSKTHDIEYSGWEAALRGYNGWPPDYSCKGDPDYVSNVLIKYNNQIPDAYKKDDKSFGFSS